MGNYNFREIEEKWRHFWDENNTYYTDVRDFSKPKYYILDMFPYPSGQGLHVGHPRGYITTDIVARMKRMQGYNVLHPMGFDSFGLPAEQYAIKTGNSPIDFTYKNIDNYIGQMKLMGLGYDWSKKIATCDPEYYKWTQWMFKQLFLDGYAKYEDCPVNWCEELGTVLANDEIINGKSERGGFPVVRKNMKQWVINIPTYAEKLLEGLDELDWTEQAKTTQRNWIGKSKGANITFEVSGTKEHFTVFTTRPDTLFGATYCVLAPEHKLIDTITTNECKKAVEEYKKICLTKSDLERTELNKEKTGVFTGAYAINPVNQAKLPIYISDYVITTYGTGAIMSVPAHDQRDYEFAKKFNLDIIPVIEGGDISVQAYEADGKHINSDFLNGLDKQEAINVMCKYLEDHNLGKATTSYKLRNWIFARQRYWGEPVPILHNGDECIALEDEELPLELPKLKDFKTTNGQAPLESAEEWKYVNRNGKTYKRETSTMPSSAGSCWYYMRYIDPHNDDTFADYELMKHWLPVDLYVGGSEHLTGHLIYSRFWNRYFYDKGLVQHKEPFKKLVNQGLILGPNGEKMSKSKGNVINPDDIIAEYGADTLRLYEMFIGPITDTAPWDTSNIEGVKRFIDRIYRLYFELDYINDKQNDAVTKVYHETVKKVTENFEKLEFNTAISQMMIFINTVYKEKQLNNTLAENFIKLISPICPFIAEEVWQQVFEHNESITTAKWPTYDENMLKNDTFELVISYNGKFISKQTTPMNTSKEELIKLAKDYYNAHPKDGKQIKNVIAVENKLVNIVLE